MVLHQLTSKLGKMFSKPTQLQPKDDSPRYIYFILGSVEEINRYYDRIIEQELDAIREERDILLEYEYRSNRFKREVLGDYDEDFIAIQNACLNRAAEAEVARNVSLQLSELSGYEGPLKEGRIRIKR